MDGIATGTAPRRTAGALGWATVGIVDLIVADADASFCAVMGCDQQELVGSPIGAFVADDQLAPAVRRVAELSSDGTGREVVARSAFRHPDGRWRWIDFALTLRAGRGAPDGQRDAAAGLAIVAFGEERRHGARYERRRLTRRRDDHRGTPNEASVDAERPATWEIELLRDVAITANQATSVDEALQQVLALVCAATGWPMGRVRLEGKHHSLGTWNANPAAGDAACDQGRASVLAAPIVTDGGEVIGMLELSGDPEQTANERLEALMRQLADELGPMIKRARADAARARAAQTMSEFISNAAHELRTPAAVVSQLAELLSLRYGELSADQLRRALDALSTEGRWLSALAGQLLDLSQVDSDRPHIELGPCDVGAVVGQTLDTVPPPATHGVTVGIPPATVAIADAVRLEQILVNLLQNAYRYGGRQIEVTARSSDSAVEISVSDNGPGLDADFVEVAFEPFTRGRPADQETRAGGTGLGLVIVRRLARLQGGDVRYEARSPRGARFVVRLPAAAAG